MTLATGPGTDVYWRKVSTKKRAYDESVTFNVTDILARVPAGRFRPTFQQPSPRPLFHIFIDFCPRS